MIRLKFFNGDDVCVYETTVFSASFTRALSKSGSWSASVPLTAALYDLLGESLIAEMWYDKTYCIGGRVQQVPVKYDADPAIEIKGREEVDALYDEPADSTLYINNKSFLLQLFTLLQESGWRLGLYQDIDRTKLITYDLRKEKQRLTQIASLIKQVPNLSYRFGGYDVDGQPMLDVSLFDDEFVHTLLPSQPGLQTNSVVIADVQSTDDYTTRVYAMEVVGGDVQDNAGAKRTVRLADLANFTTLRFDTVYPIYEEVTELAYVIVPAAEGAIGGKVQSFMTTPVNTTVMGDVAGTGLTSYWMGIVFHPFPGNLTECSFWFGTISASLESNKLTNPLLWEVREVDEGNVLTCNGPLIGSGTVDPSVWTANARCRVVFPPSMAVVGTKRYMFRCGFSAVPAASAVATVKVTTTNNAKSFRLDRSAGQGSASNATFNYQPLFEAVTAGTASRNGRRTYEVQTKFAPVKENANATLADIQAAALALYEWAKLQLAVYATYKHEIAVTLAGFDLTYKPGDSVQLLTQTQFIEGNRAAWEVRQIESIDTNFSDQAPKSTIKFLPNISDDEEDLKEVSLYSSQKKKEAPPDGKIIEAPYAWELTELTSLVQYKVPDTNLSDGTPAVTVTFNLTSAPVGKGETQLMGTPYAIHVNSNIVTVTEVVSKSSTVVVCRIAIRDVGWTLYDTATVYCHQVWR